MEIDNHKDIWISDRNHVRNMPSYRMYIGPISLLKSSSIVYILWAKDSKRNRTNMGPWVGPK